MAISRLFSLPPADVSAFIFGPRMTGKTTLLKSIESCALKLDLLDPDEQLRYSMTPSILKDQLEALPTPSRIIIDEIQRVPALLDYVQIGMEKYQHSFLLSGSSARKLKRGSANMLGGRALDLRLHPLTFREIGEAFDISSALQMGTLPKIYTTVQQGRAELAALFLRSYLTTYLKEEIQAEALTRNLGAFQRFLAIAGQSAGQVIEFSNIARDSSVAASTVKEYYQVLEDTLIGFYLWPYDRNERKKARPKFYFFDCGVTRALQGRLADAPTPQERGFLFEAFMANELVRLRDYAGKFHEFGFWRERTHEVDILVSGGHGPILAIECKAGSQDIDKSTIEAFKARFPTVPLIVASLQDEHPRILHGIEVLPWPMALQRYEAI